MLTTGVQTGGTTSLTGSDAPCRACGRQVAPTCVRQLSPQREVRRCPACSVTGLEPLPTEDELAHHYADYYLTRNKDSRRHDWLIEAHRPIVKWLLARSGGSGVRSFLDFGFGSGEFLIQVARQGHLAHGCDLSVRAMADLQTLAEATGEDVRAVLYDRLLTDAACPRFHVITLFQVIEHLREPLSVVRTLSRWQAEGDLLYVECPNDASGLAWFKSQFLFGDRRERMWRSLKYPEHLNGFNKGALRILLETAGYQVVMCRDYAYGDGLHQVEGEYWWPAWRCNPNRWTVYGFSRSAIRTVDGWLSDALGRGSGLYALARRAA